MVILLYKTVLGVNPPYETGRCRKLLVDSNCVKSLNVSSASSSQWCLIALKIDLLLELSLVGTSKVVGEL
jgi:hypothetical protein